MTFEEIMILLEEYGTKQTRKVYTNQGIPDPKFGVKVADLKKIKKKIKKNYELSMELFETSNYDAMYLAGLIADVKAMSKKDLEHWMDVCNGRHIASFIISKIAAESDFGLELARVWMESENEIVKSGGYATYTNIITISKTENLDIKEITNILDTILERIHKEANDVRYEMNSFVIAAGGYIPALASKAKNYGKLIGKVEYKLGNSSCKIPEIVSYIEKMEAKAALKKK